MAFSAHTTLLEH